MSILQPTDFDNGRFKIPTNSFQELDLLEYINRYELQYLPLLFGVELYELFIANLVAGVPTSQRFEDVFNAFLLQNDCDYCNSEGMKEMMKAFIYFHYTRDTFTRNTTNGVKQTFSENSVSLDTVSADLTTRYNEGVKTFDCIQRKMCEESETYPEYEGLNLESVLFI